MASSGKPRVVQPYGEGINPKQTCDRKGMELPAFTKSKMEREAPSWAQPYGGKVEPGHREPRGSNVNPKVKRSEAIKGSSRR
eukprot:998962-Amphidinium_carterae.1